MTLPGARLPPCFGAQAVSTTSPYVGFGVGPAPRAVAPAGGRSTTVAAMVGRRDVGSWLEGPGRGSGPRPVRGAADPGARLGRPADGPGSIGSFLRRLGGLAIDWVLCLAVAQGLLASVGPRDVMTLAVLLAENVLLVGTLGATVGHRVVGLRVETLEGGLPGPVRALGRSALLVLAVPALIWDSDQRGLHDKAVGTLVVRTR